MNSFCARSIGVDNFGCTDVMLSTSEQEKEIGDYLYSREKNRLRGPRMRRTLMFAPVTLNPKLS